MLGLGHLSTFMEQGGIHVAIAAEKFGEWMGIPITNTLLASWGVILILSLAAILLSRRLYLVPGRTQSLVEMFFSGVYDYIAETLESTELARKYFPLIVTLFVFILAGNLIEFIPGSAAVHYHGSDGEGPLLRSITTDLNVTLALALISFCVIEVSGISHFGARAYLSRFFNFHSVVGFFVGIIEFISELVRLISFSFRLFGNIFAGAVLISVIFFFLPVAMPVPFMLFEIFVAFVQAGIFAILTLFFLKQALTAPEH